jgi:hypothetical protein
MSAQTSDQNYPPPDSELIRPCEEVLQSLADGHLTAASAASKVAAITVPDPNIHPEEIGAHLWELWQTLLAYLARNPGRVKTIADLIWCIARPPPVLTEARDPLAVDDGCRRVWQDLSRLGWELSEEWNCEYRYLWS